MPAKLTDEDKILLERWKQMQPQQQQQRIINNLQSLSNEVTSMSSEITTTSDTPITTTAAAAATAGDGDDIELCSADSRLADRCLRETNVTWTPSIRMSSADIASCLQSPNHATLTAADAVAAATTTTAAGDCDDIELCSADSKLADKSPDMIWTPSISLSSADIASCLQSPNNCTLTVAETGDCDAGQRCCAGYGIGEILPPSSDKYVISLYTCADLCRFWMLRPALFHGRMTSKASKQPALIRLRLVGEYL